MSKIGSHFDRSEFKCKCGNCDFDTVDAQLITLLEAVRNHFDAPVIINSACRCRAHNSNIGGSPKSQHLYGRAADIVVKGHSPAEVQDVLESFMKGWGGIGSYETFTHVDSRSNGPARWKG
jgi:uncharacterized protein YcbK (DUF882 family)